VDTSLSLTHSRCVCGPCACRVRWRARPRQKCASSKPLLAAENPDTRPPTCRAFVCVCDILRCISATGSPKHTHTHPARRVYICVERSFCRNKCTGENMNTARGFHPPWRFRSRKLSPFLSLFSLSLSLLVVGGVVRLLRKVWCIHSCLFTAACEARAPARLAGRTQADTHPTTRTHCACNSLLSLSALLCVSHI
jgi:hypothetical protein